MAEQVTTHEWSIDDGDMGLIYLQAREGGSLWFRYPNESKWYSTAIDWARRALVLELLRKENEKAEAL